MTKPTEQKKPEAKKPILSAEQMQLFQQRVAYVKSTSLTLAVQLNHGSGDIKKVKEHFGEFKEMLGLVK